MKRFLLFAGATYHPDGGWEDFVKDFDTKEEAIAAGRRKIRDWLWFHVVDTQRRGIVYRSE